MVGYMGNEVVPSKKVEIHYESKNGFWYATIDQFQTGFYSSKRDAAIAGNKLALRAVGDSAQLINAEQFIG